MTTKTDITLPPLPEHMRDVAAWLEAHNDAEIARDILNYARAAVEADRQKESTKKYQIGDETHRRVFKATGLTNLSDMQAVLDAVESALVEAAPKENCQGDI